MAVGFPAPGAAELEKLECLPLQELISIGGGDEKPRKFASRTSVRPSGPLVRRIRRIRRRHGDQHSRSPCGRRVLGINGTENRLKKQGRP